MKKIIFTAITAVLLASCTQSNKTTNVAHINHNHMQCYMANTLKAIEQQEEHTSVEWRELCKN